MKDNNTVYLKTEDLTPEPIDFSEVEVSDNDNCVTILLGKHPNYISLSIPKENFDGFVAAVNEYCR